jgi:hypothetical protein
MVFALMIIFVAATLTVTGLGFGLVLTSSLVFGLLLMVSAFSLVLRTQNP